MSAAAADQPAVTGYVEAITGTAVLGWAWIPGQAESLTMELRLDGQVVATALASELRADLARSGIGEGRHAFTLPIPEAARGRIAELRVLARAGDGPAVPIGSPPVEDGLTRQLAELQKGLELVVGSQRVLHRNVQAVLLERAADAGPGVAEIAATQVVIQESLATLELFVVRLEISLANQAPAVQRPQPGWVLGGAAAAGLALAISFWALLHSMPG